MASEQILKRAAAQSVLKTTVHQFIPSSKTVEEASLVDIRKNICGL